MPFSMLESHAGPSLLRDSPSECDSEQFVLNLLFEIIAAVEVPQEDNEIFLQLHQAWWSAFHYKQDIFPLQHTPL